MPDVQPFRAWRYNPDQVGDLADVIAPPYDVIDAAEQLELYQRHPCNIVRLILNRAEPGDSGDLERYHRAAGFLQQWQQQGVLVRDPEPAVTVYHQQVGRGESSIVRRGFLARVRLEELGTGSIYPHEQTMPGPKADRLALWQHCRTCLSPIFGLHSASATDVQEPFEAACRDTVPVEVTDRNGVLHRMWPVNDREVIAGVTAALADAEVFIADGHHRYETALACRDAAAAGGSLDHDHPARFTLMMFVALDEPGLSILPTHRLVSGPPPLHIDELAEVLGECFEIERLDESDNGAGTAWAAIERDGGQDLIAFGTAADHRWLLARLVDHGPIDSLAADHGSDWRSLGVARLKCLVLDHLLPKRYPEASISCRYVHELDEVAAALAGGEVPLAALVAPASLDHVRRIALARETMPPKSTFFHPKLLSGLVLYPLEDPA